MAVLIAFLVAIRIQILFLVMIPTMDQKGPQQALGVFIFELLFLTRVVSKTDKALARRSNDALRTMYMMVLRAMPSIQLLVRVLATHPVEDYLDL